MLDLDSFGAEDESEDDEFGGTTIRRGGGSPSDSDILSAAGMQCPKCGNDVDDSDPDTLGIFCIECGASFDPFLNRWIGGDDDTGAGLSAERVIEPIEPE